MIKMTRDRMKRDPEGFKRTLPPQVQQMMASTGADVPLSLIDQVADFSPERLKQIVSFIFYMQNLYTWVDEKSGGRAQMIGIAVFVFLLSVVLFFLVWLMWSIVGFLGRMIFGSSTAAATMAGGSMPQQPIPQQVILDEEVHVVDGGDGWDEV